MNDNKNKKTKKRAAATAAAVITAAGTVIGGSFDSPAELMNDDQNMFSPGSVAEYAIDDCTDDGDDAGEPEERGKRSRVRRFVHAMPAGVRAVVGVPLWCVGWLIITLASVLWSAVLSPAVGTVLRWALTAAIMLAVLLAMLKLVFPDMPLKQIFNKRSILTAFIGVGLVGMLDAILRFFLPDERTVAELLRFFGTMAVFTLSSLPLISSEVKRRREQKKREEEAERDKYLRRCALELADSVSAK